MLLQPSGYFLENLSFGLFYLSLKINICSEAAQPSTILKFIKYNIYKNKNFLKLLM